MPLTSADIAAVLQTDVSVEGEFTATAIENGFPAALWGQPLTVDPRAVLWGQQSLTVDPKAAPITAASGIEIRPAHPVTAGASQDLQVGKLAYDKTLFAVAASTWTLRQGPAVVEPTALPLAELAALGLDTDGLAWVAHPADRDRIDMMTGLLETAHG